MKLGITVWFQVIKIAANFWGEIQFYFNLHYPNHSLLKLVIIFCFKLNYFCSQWWNLELSYDFKWLKLRKFNSTSIFNILIHSLLKLVIFNILNSIVSSIVYYFLFSMMKLGITVWFQVIKIAANFWGEIQFYFNLHYPNP